MSFLLDIFGIGNFKMFYLSGIDPNQLCESAPAIFPQIKGIFISREGFSTFDQYLLVPAAFRDFLQPIMLVHPAARAVLSLQRHFAAITTGTEWSYTLRLFSRS